MQLAAEQGVEYSSPTVSYSEGSETEQLHQNTANLFYVHKCCGFHAIPRGDMTDSKSLNVLLAWAEINI